MSDHLVHLKERLVEFRDQRDWEQFHSPKNLAMALAAEAGELLAEFQWLTEEQSAEARLDGDLRNRVTGELADVTIYLVLLADKLGIDLIKAAETKLVVNERRFPRP